MDYKFYIISWWYTRHDYWQVNLWLIETMIVVIPCWRILFKIGCIDSAFILLIYSRKNLSKVGFIFTTQIFRLFYFLLFGFPVWGLEFILNLKKQVFNNHLKRISHFVKITSFLIRDYTRCRLWEIQKKDYFIVIVIKYSIWHWSVQ